MRRGLWKICLAALACLLTGCSLTSTPSVEELLRAPQLSGQHSQVQKALDSYLGESAQLKYPTSGQGLSPFVFGDLDGDGVEDAAVLYTSTAKGQNVHVAILEQTDSGWTVTQEQEGLSTEVDSVSLASLQEGSSAQQLVVGYASPQGDQYLAVYAYQDSTLSCVLQEAYSRYLVADITGRGVEDLVVVAPVAEGGLRLKLLTAGPDGFTIGQELLTDSRFVDCASLQISRGSDGGHYLVMDGLVGSSGSYMASCLFRCDEAGRQLEPVPEPGGVDLYTASLRYYGSLYSMDINNDGMVEIPTQVQDDSLGITSLVQEHRLSFVAWNSYTSQRSRQVSFGVLDEEYGYYLPVPFSLRGQISLCDSGTDGWEIRDLTGDTLYLRVRVAPLTTSLVGYTRIATVGSQQVGARLGPDSQVFSLESLAKRTLVL